MNQPLRFAVVGCGMIGRIHIDVIAELDGGELCAVVDRNPSRAAEIATAHGAHSYTDLGQMLGREHPDVVTVCMPSGMHGEIACAAMRAGCHVIVEKPMEIRLDRIDAMLRVQEEMGVKIAVISQRRFDPAILQVRSLLQVGSLGRVVMGNAHLLWWRTQSYYDSGRWRGTWALDGGGALMNQGVHSVDQLLWLMGPVRTVSALTDTLAHHIETEDTAVAALRFDSGALGTLIATTSAYPGVTARLEILGDRGSAVIENEEISFLRTEADEKEQKMHAAPGLVRKQESGASARNNPAALDVSAHSAQYADMIAAVREDRDPVVDGHAARAPVELILAVYESARTGLPVTLP